MRSDRIAAMASNNNKNPVSSNSRKKLNAFRFQDDEVASNKTSSKHGTKKAHRNKENQSSWLNGVVEPMPKPADKSDKKEKVEPPAAVDQPITGAPATDSKPAKDCPQTPGNRIPLADLISNAEDAFNPAPGPEVTPVDHVIWQHIPASSNPDSSQTPAGRRKKRRHSSSPPGSPSKTNSKKASKEPLDLQSIQALFKTPQHDLATELWNNYKDKNMMDNSEDLPPPRLANLLSSSPQTPGSGRTSRDSSGLRRSISCAAEWPTSRAKRRRVNNQDPSEGRATFSRANSNVLDSGKGKSSRINFLLEKIERSLKPAQSADTGPPNSSPLRHRIDAERCRSSSPIADRKGAVHAAPGKEVHSVLGHNTRAIPAPILEESSSEFGDDDLDQEFMDMAASEDPFVTAPSASRGSNNEFGSLGSSGWSNIVAEKPQGHQVQLPIPVKNPPAVHNELNVDPKPDDSEDFDDDFGDFDDILAECDNQHANPILFKPNTHEQQAEKRLGPSAVPPVISAAPATTKGAVVTVDEFSDDEFDDDFDLDAIEQTMKKTGADGPHNLKYRQAIKRYSIVDITEGAYVNSKGRTQPEQVLSVEDEKTRARKVIVLRETWFDTPCSKDSFVHLVGDFNPSGICIVDNTNHMIILHPDHLISATVVADSIDCQRRAVLQDRIKAFSQLERPQVFGTIFHEVFQEALKVNLWDLKSLRSLVDVVLQRHIEDLYAIQMSVPEATEDVMSKIPTVQAWAEVFLHAKPKANSMVEDRHNTRLNLSISKLLEVEEHVWSPMYGLKGNIDATVQVVCRSEEGEKNLLVPLELKTGKRDTNEGHRAQTALYTLLLSDRYDIDVTFGLLYYLELNKTFSVRGVRHELLQMVQLRNRLSVFIREKVQLPPMLKKARMCNRCYAKTPCLIYHKLLEGGDGETSALGEDFDAATGHLTQKDREFFTKWDDLLNKEEGNLAKFRRELWTLLSSERESLGRCFGDVVIQPESAFEDIHGSRINRFRYTFVKKQAPPNFTFAESQLVVGEPVVVSDEKGHFALSNGYVLSVSRSSITVGVDRRLLNTRSRTAGFNPVTNQSFTGIMEVEKDGKMALENPLDEQVIYRVDKDEFSNGMANIRNNLVCMMDKEIYQAKHLRRLIIEGQPPVFKPSSSAYTISDPESLNVDQRQAIEKVMTAKDYALILGMPGTGKTTTIAHLIRALVAQGKSVLLTSYTHTAVDNILLKIRDDDIRILRLGAATKVHPDVRDFADLAANPKTTIEELKDSYEKPQVVAATCLGVNHQIFNQRIFDYCIVDEASQITLPVCLGPIRMARSFILVGDHYQLPPLVQSKAAQEGGLDISLFKLLSDNQPDSVVNLEHQYRMCEDVMLLSNTLIYSGRLKCGTPEVAARSLVIPNISALQKFHTDSSDASHTGNQGEKCHGSSHGRCWLQDLLAPSAKTLLVNTDPLGTAALETVQGQRVVNSMEIMLCSQLVEAFIACGIPARDIGVITFYRSQLALLRHSLRRYAPDLEMHTTDKFQGRDKEIVILSCVRSNSDNHVGELMRDWRRVNVAFTRARTKLLVIGSRSTMRDGNDLLRKYVDLVDGKKWVYNLPQNAAENHVFESSALDALPSPQPAKALGSTNKKDTSVNKDPRDRDPLSPLGSRQFNSSLRQPAKRGSKVLNGNKVLGNRPILQDIVNDLAG